MIDKAPDLRYFTPDWMVPENVCAVITTRQGGCSGGAYAENNLALHVGDDSNAVTRNRSALAEAVGVNRWQWLEQVHGVDVHSLQGDPQRPAPQADACYTRQRNRVCTVLTADCLPVLLCSRHGDEVAVVHAGWRGLCAGILPRTVRRFNAAPSDVLAYLGPAIGPLAFEVGEDVVAAYRDSLRSGIDADYEADAMARCFQATDQRAKYLANLYLMAREHLAGVGLNSVSGGDFCTYSDARRFYSYRRDGVTGRFASAIWLR